MNDLETRVLPLKLPVAIWELLDHGYVQTGNSVEYQVALKLLADMAATSILSQSALPDGWFDRFNAAVTEVVECMVDGSDYDRPLWED